MVSSSLGVHDMRLIQSKKLIIAVYIFVFLAIVLLTSLTPMLADDYSYSFSYADRTVRIQTLGDIFASLKAHRANMNGRMISHGLAMLFLLLPKTVFNVVNALNAVFLLHLCVCFLPEDFSTNRRKLVFLILTALLIWVFMPVFGQVFLWLDGSLNYSWAMTAVLVFLRPFYRSFLSEGLRRHKSVLRTGLFFVISFIAGAYSENASCAAILMAFCFLVLIYKKKKTVQRHLIASLVFACLGFLFMMTAPAEGSRAAQTDLIGIAKNIQRVFEAPQKTLLSVYCSFAFLFTLVCMTKRNSQALMTAFVFFIGSVASVAVFVFAVYFPWRSLCSATVFMIIADLILMAALWEEYGRIFIPALTAALAMYCAFSFVLAVGDVSVLYMESKQREAAILSGIEQDNNPIEIHQYSSNTKYAASYLLPDIYDDSRQWPNYDIAAYYGAPAIVGLPPVEEFGTE